MNQSDTISYSSIGFDNDRYLDLQSKEISKRIESTGGKLYLEIGGKFPYDPHATRILPGFKNDNKLKILSMHKHDLDIIFCVSAKDILKNRMLSNTEKGYVQTTLEIIQEIENQMGIKPRVAINLIEDSNHEMAIMYSKQMQELGYEVYNRFAISGYPESPSVLSAAGYGQDDYIPVDKHLVVVIGAASNSGKMSTSLGQVYQESTMGNRCGYAKYETFPIWNLPLDHPVNIAYEAATADIGDFNVIDQYHLKEYGAEAVNYNRDAEAFKIVSTILEQLDGIQTYKSPTEMGINTAGEAIIDDEIVSIASFREIDRRIEWYKQNIASGNGDEKWITACHKLKERALKYIKEKGYNINLSI